MVQSYYNQPEMVMAQKSLELSAIKKLCHITESVDRTDKADNAIVYSWIANSWIAKNAYTATRVSQNC